MTPHRKKVFNWCILMYHVINLKQTPGIKNVTLKAEKYCECRGLLGRVIRMFVPKFSNIDFCLKILPLKDDELMTEI